MLKTGDGGPVGQSRGMMRAGDEESLENPAGMLKAKDAVRVKLVINDLVPYNNLQMLNEKPIGSGAVGDVYRAVHKDWGCHVAYKKLDVRFITGNSRIKDLKNEAEIHHLLRHPHIVSLLGVVFEQNNYGLVLEYLLYRSLEEFLINIKDKTGRSFSISSKLKLKMAYDVCGGMSYLHTLQSPIIHGDLKIQNLLIGDHLIVKISDFGLSKWKDFSRTHTKHVGVIRGTPSHVPPEHWLNPDQRPDEKFDVYSFSIALWEMFTEDQAYAYSRDCLSELVIHGRRPSLDKLPRDLPTVVSGVIENCWQQEPIKRPTFSELISRLKDFTPSQHESEEAIREALVIYHIKDTASEHGRKMDQVSSKLSDVIRRTDQILTHLLEERAVTLQEFDGVRSQSTIHNLMRHLLDLLSSKPVTAYHCFLDALTKTNQEHLHKLLETGADMNMDHREVLIDHYTYLKASLNVNHTGLLDRLLQSRVLDDQELREIQSKRTLDESVDQLLHLIMRTSPEQYQLFLSALRNCNLDYIAAKLLSMNGALSEPQIAVCLSAPVLQMESQHDTVDAGTLFVTDSKNLLTAVEEIYRRPNDAIESERSTLFLAESTVIRVIPGADKGLVWGIAVLGSQLFIGRDKATSVEVYDTDNMTTTPHLLKISQKIRLHKFFKHGIKLSNYSLHWPRLAACSQHNCLYVIYYSGNNEPEIFRVELSNSSVSRWRVKWADTPIVSITNDHTVLVTVCKERTVGEYTTRGELIREIRLDHSIDSPRHCIQLSDGNFVISHCGSTQHRVCIVDASGRILKSYGGSQGSDIFQLADPRQLAVDKYDHVFVADCYNDRVQLLSSTLTLLCTIQIPGHQLSQPTALHFDNINHRLYVESGSDVLVVELSFQEK